MRYSIEELEKMADEIRKKILFTAYQCGKTVHIGGSLSMVEILTVLYSNYLNFEKDDLFYEDRDRFILSKGHCALALYTVLNKIGVISDKELATYLQDDTELTAHPVRNLNLGIESSNGSLGQGISMAVGVAKAAKIKKKSFKVYTLVGNGESNEGSVWEAAMLAATWKLDNLTVILDHNKLQSDGLSTEIIDMQNMSDKWKSFGFTVYEVNGHEVSELCKAFEASSKGCPKIIIANTIKGKGISFMEGNNEWHHNRVTQRNYESIINELEK